MTPQISYSYKYVWGICESHPEAVVAVAVAVAITISVTLSFTWKIILLFKKKKDDRK